jgi:AAA domain
MKLIFLSGLPGVGKLTVAKELSALTGLKLFHNHLTVDLLLSIFEFGSLPFIELRESIWLSVFEEACHASLPGLIFTFNPENTVRQSFIEKTKEMVSSQGGQVLFIELICDEEELERRMDAPSRREHKKLTSWKQYEELKAAGVFSSPTLPAPLLSIDTGKLDPKGAALLIARKCGLKS